MALCILCEVLAKSPQVPFRRLFSVDEAESEVLCATLRFAAISDVSPVVQGHLLVVSKAHVRSMASMSRDALLELNTLIASIEQTLESNYGPCVVFEHGSGVKSRGAACIDHAHMHIVPSSGDLHILSRYSDTFTRIAGIGALEIIGSEVGYLLVRSTDRIYWLSLHREVERQHLRRVLAESNDGRFQDWRLMNHSTKGMTLARKRIKRVRELFIDGAFGG